MSDDASKAALTLYTALVNDGTAEEVDEFLNLNLTQLGYAKAVWHLWRFRRFENLEGVRKNLFERFNSNAFLPWQALELLYYLQENRRTGDVNHDDSLQCAAIFRALCRCLSQDSTLRDVALRLALVWHGQLDKTNDLQLPAADDADAMKMYGNLGALERMLMEGGRVNRCQRMPVALTIGIDGNLTWTDQFTTDRSIELYIGPYFFKDLDETQRLGARLPKTFKSPFREGLQLLAQAFLSRGWKILPWLTWRGGLAPICPPRGKFSFSYHTHGDVAGRWHYKFGHFSNLIQIDRLGYAGFSTLALLTAEDIRAGTADIDDGEISELLAPYKLKYIEQRFTWRQQNKEKPQGLIRGRRTIFVPLQDPLDEISSLGYLTPAELLQALTQCTSLADRIYVKRHPVDDSTRTTRLLEEFSDDPRFFIVDASIHDLFQVCDLVVTINSGVGFEALLAGLPVVSCGRSDYNLATTTVRCTDSLIKAIDRGIFPSFAWRQRVVYYYFKNHVFDPTHPEDFDCRLAKVLGLLPS